MSSIRNLINKQKITPGIIDTKFMFSANNRILSGIPSTNGMKWNIEIINFAR